MRNHEESGGARQEKSGAESHTLTESARVDRLLEHWIALEERKLAILERQAAATERLADAMGGTAKKRLDDVDCYRYLLTLGLPLPPTRTIAQTAGCSHSHLLDLERMPLTAAYIKQHSGRKRRWGKKDDSESDGRYDE